MWDLLCSDCFSQPDVVERLAVIDISPVGTTPVSDLRDIITVMKSVDVPEKVTLSQARKLVDKQLSSVVKVIRTLPLSPAWCCPLRCVRGKK